jgi:hydroxymethylpyrimidine/phosphomethylpyrimidine kinase
MAQGTRFRLEIVDWLPSYSSMSQRQRFPVVLTVAGSDSGGGAGIQADLKTFAALGVHGTVAITCLTAQNPSGVRAIQACRPDMVQQQIEAVLDELPPTASKTGMLYSAAIIRTVAAVFRNRSDLPLVVDPVMIATSGARLLRGSAVRALAEELLPCATLVTPNLDEATVLIGKPITTLEAARTAARTIHQRYGCAVLVKGGHLKGLRDAVDFYFDGREEWLLRAPRVAGIATHGTGCTYSAAIAGYLALGCSLTHAVHMAKEYITQAITQAVRVQRHMVLNHLWR